MIRASEAKPGDRTYEATTVETATVLTGGNLTLLVVRDDEGEQYDQVWRSDDPINTPA